MTEQKTGWFSRLRCTPKKSACWRSFEIEETTEEESVEQDVKTSKTAAERLSDQAITRREGDLKPACAIIPQRIHNGHCCTDGPCRGLHGPR